MDCPLGLNINTNVAMSEDLKKQMEQKLWEVANSLRSKINADEYRNYILGFIFYKYLSDKQLDFANEQLEGEEVTDYTVLKDEEALVELRKLSTNELGYFLLPNQLFGVLAAKGQGKGDENSGFIITELSDVLGYIERSTMGTESEEDFNGLFGDLDLASGKLGKTPDKRNEVVASIMASLDSIDFQLHNAESDVLGDAYEYLIGKFAAGAGKSAGEFYTPQEVSTILARLVTMGKTRIPAVYDPTCGSGSLLLRVAKEINVGHIYGQELNPTTYNLARMNMIMHNVHYTNFTIVQDDTLEDPDPTILSMRFDAIVANPPFSAEWKGDKNPLNEQDERFSSFGALAPNKTADYAFLQHMYHHLSDGGTLASVFPHGVLFRGGKEGKIREHFIKELNAIDAIIGLPANIFFGTSIPTCIVVMKKCRKVNDNVVFIDASGEGNFIKEGTSNKLRAEDIDRILDAYRNRVEIEKYCHITSLAELEENDYNLNIPRYVDTFEEEEPVDVQAVSTELAKLDIELGEVDVQLAAFCDELNIPKPF